MGSGTLVLGLALLAATRLPGPPERLAPWTGLPVLLGGMAILWPREQTLSRAIRIVAVAAVVNLAVFHAGLKDHYLADCDLQPVARKVARLQQAGTPVAYWGRYHGQFHFTGRLQQPLTQLDGSVVAAQHWLRANPGGVLFRDVRLKHCDRPAIQDSQVVWSRPFLKGLANHQAELVRYRAPDRPVISDTAAGPGTHAAIGRSPQQDF